MVAEKTLVEEEIRATLWKAGLPDEHIAAIVGVVSRMSDVTVDRLEPRLDALGTALRPAIVELIESEVNLRMGRMEQRVENIRRSMPLPKSNYFDEEDDVRPRRRWRHYVALGFAAMILGPIALSLLAAGMKVILGLMLHLLS